jgi:hypothetical protein
VNRLVARNVHPLRLLRPRCCGSTMATGRIRVGMRSLAQPCSTQPPVPGLAMQNSHSTGNLWLQGRIPSAPNVRALATAAAMTRGPAEHPLGEYPARTLFVRNINIHSTDEELLTLFRQYGEIRSMYAACKHRGFVMISYYDIRAATRAKQMLQVCPRLQPCPCTPTCPLFVIC